MIGNARVSSGRGSIWAATVVLAGAMLAVAGVAMAQPLGQVGQGLTAGAAALAAGEDAQRGLILVVTTRPDGSAVGCSGVLLTNAWALTAGHCIDALQGSTTTATASYAAGTFTADAIYKLGGWADDPTGPDIGLLRFTAPVPVGGSTSGFSTRMYQGDASGKTVTVYGASTGAYLKADMPVNDAQGRNLSLGASVAGVTTAPGDSGGPAFLAENGQVFLAGLTSTSGPPARSAAIAPHRNWIVAATRAFMEQAQPFDDAAALPEEVRSVPEGDLLPNGASVLVDSPWARAQRVAQWMCTKRGFIGGTFVPGAVGSPGQYRFACVGRSGGIWRDATQAEINATGWGFLDPDAVGWAQASRAASGLCAQFLPGSAGGVLTGFRAKPPGDPDQRMGVVCLNGSAGRFSDVQATQLPVAGGDLNTLPWLAAQQDVSAFCRGPSGQAVSSLFRSVGGFSSGHQTPSLRGVTCIGRLAINIGPVVGPGR